MSKMSFDYKCYKIANLADYGISNTLVAGHEVQLKEER
jgi:hypothetical protein